MGFSALGGSFNPLAPCGARQGRKQDGRGVPAFNPLAPCGARPPHGDMTRHAWIFQSTRPLRGETSQTIRPALSDGLSIHSPLAGRDPSRSWKRRSGRRFQSTRPLRGETPQIFSQLRPGRNFQSTRPLRGETQVALDKALPRHLSIHSPLAGRDSILTTIITGIGLSIHSPLAGRDADRMGIPVDHLKLSIHSPLAGRDLPGTWLTTKKGFFQSTRPLRGETQSRQTFSLKQFFQSTRPLRGETRHHLLHKGGNFFQSTRPLRGETAVFPVGRYGLALSIHSPLAGRDSITSFHLHWPDTFNPLAPCGARHAFQPHVYKRRQPFNPLAPCGARPEGSFPLAPAIRFQSTRPLRGETRWRRGCWYGPPAFNPLAPCGARHLVPVHLHARKPFNPLAPCGARPKRFMACALDEAFQSTRPLRGET